MQYVVLQIFISLFLLSTCAREFHYTTSEGYAYKLIDKGRGRKAVEGDYLLFHLTQIDDGEVIFTSHAHDKENAIKLEDQENVNLSTKSIIECLYGRRAGDSLVLLIPNSAFFEGSEMEEDTSSMMAFQLQITNVLDGRSYGVKTQEQIDQEKREKAMRKAKFKQVELFVNNTYQLLKSNPESLSIEQTSSGLKYIIHEQGHGEQFESHETVEIHYYGLLLADGSLFDNSFEADLLFRFELGADQVIRGFNEGVALLRKGSKATLIIPYALAYGRKGDAPTIPKSADLIYYIEVPK